MVFLDRVYKICIFMQCAPDPDEFFQSIFGLRRPML